MVVLRDTSPYLNLTLKTRFRFWDFHFILPGGEEHRYFAGDFSEFAKEKETVSKGKRASRAGNLTFYCKTRLFFGALRAQISYNVIVKSLTSPKRLLSARLARRPFGYPRRIIPGMPAPRELRGVTQISGNRRRREK